MFLYLLVVFLACVLGWKYWNTQNSRFPPGPLPLPILGHLPMLGTKPQETFGRWKKTYGSIFSLWIGNYYRCIVVTDGKLIREVLQMNEFSGRPRINLLDSRCDDNIPRGIGTTEGSTWMEQRRFAIKYLRELGYGKMSTAQKIQGEIDELLIRLESKKGRPIQVINLFNSAVVNSIWMTLFGERLDQENKEAQDAFHSFSASVGDSALLPLCLPWVAKIAPGLSGYKRMVQQCRHFTNFVLANINRHKESYIVNQPRGFVDAYMDETRRTTDSRSSFHVANENLTLSVFDMIAAGVESTSSTLAWICAYLVHYKNVQTKLKDEIDYIIGNQRVPSLDDRALMPYTEAFISEILRITSLIPFNFPHRAIKDVEFRGFFIPKDTVVIANLYSAHFDENIWGDPQNFRPERFLENGKFKPNENLIPFSTGKRVCIGESLARDQLFLFTTNVLQTFHLSESQNLPDLTVKMSMEVVPPPFEIYFEKRA